MPSAERRKKEKHRATATNTSSAIIARLEADRPLDRSIPERHRRAFTEMLRRSLEAALASGVPVVRIPAMDEAAEVAATPSFADIALKPRHRSSWASHKRVIGLCVVWVLFTRQQPTASPDLNKPGRLTPASRFATWAAPYLEDVTPNEIREGVRLFKKGKK